MKNIFDIIENLSKKQKEKIDALTPDKKAELERRQDKRLKQYIEAQGLDKLASNLKSIAKELNKIDPKINEENFIAAIEYLWWDNLSTKSDEELNRIFGEEFPSQYYELFLATKDDDLADMALTEKSNLAKSRSGQAEKIRQLIRKVKELERASTSAK